MTQAQLLEMRRLLDGPTHRHVEAWKARGRPVVGYFCHYVPPEIILACGALPLRLRGAGSEDSALGDALLSERVCTYVRHVMSLVLDGRYGVLDGVVSSNTCDHVRRATDVFREKTPVGFVGFVSVPRSVRESLHAYYHNELARLYAALAAELGSPATDDALRRAIAALNPVRRRLLRLAELRRAKPARLSGADALVVHIAAQCMPPQDFLPWIDELLAALSAAEPLEPSRARVVLVGAELDEPSYVATIESQGALVVDDRLCFGARSVLEPLDENSADPLDTISRAYFFRPSCARMIGNFPDRFAALEEQLVQADAAGVIFERLMFCDPWGAEQHNLMKRCRERGIPLLALTREYGIVPTGQLRTRVQAFVERIEIAQQQRSAS